jgi:kynurenine formamidase/glyoxylase-like metal-dependent hydrolase (beta-lactamase superfamily II)
MRTIITIVLFVCVLNCYGAHRGTRIDVTVYHGDELIENAFVVRGKKSIVLIDALGSETAANKIVRDIAYEKLSVIFITHAHPDHFLGLATIADQHPEAKIYVANEEIRKDILRFVEFASANGLIDRTPTMKLKSADGSGFDYQRIKVFGKNQLDIDGELLTIEHVNSAESEHNTILYSEQSNLLFASDLLYNKVFNWMGPGVDQHSIKNWIATIERLKTRFRNNVIIFPGHGDKSDHSLFEINESYLRSFQTILCRTADRADAKTFFQELYPDYRGDFLLTRSIYHWFDSCIRKNKFISINNIQDLTHTLTPDFPFIPVQGITFPFAIKPIATLEQNGVRANQWTIHEHLGTQVDAPNHFAPDGFPLEKLQVTDLIVPIIVIDISVKCAQDPDAILTVNDLQQWESKHGRIPDNACVMMYSGWEQFLHGDKYLGLKKGNEKHFPGVSLEAIKFLLDERRISGVGVDVISLDPGYDNEYKGHKLLLSANKWALEAVANLKLIPENGAWLFVGAPKIQGATGSTVRLLAVW